jgi:hypothetical protein
MTQSGEPLLSNRTSTTSRRVARVDPSVVTTQPGNCSRGDHQQGEHQTADQQAAPVEGLDLAAAGCAGRERGDEPPTVVLVGLEQVSLGGHR